MEHPILEDEISYSAGYEARRASSTMSLAGVTRVAQAFCERVRDVSDSAPVRVLSLGCGDCEADTRLLDLIAPLHRIEYVGVDSSDEALRRAAQRLIGVRRNEYDVELWLADLATLDLPIGHFDVLLFSHSLYYVTDPVEVVARIAGTYASPTSVIYILLSGTVGVPSVAAVVDGLRPVYTSELLCSDLSRRGTSYTCQSFSSPLDVTEILRGSERGRDILGFCIETSVADLGPAAVAAIHRELHERSAAVGDRRYLPEHSALITVDGNALIR